MIGIIFSLTNWSDLLMTPSGFFGCFVEKFLTSAYIHFNGQNIQVFDTSWISFNKTYLYWLLSCCLLFPRHSCGFCSAMPVPGPDSANKLSPLSPGFLLASPFRREFWKEIGRQEERRYFHFLSYFCTVSNAEQEHVTLEAAINSVLQLLSVTPRTRLIVTLQRYYQ